jgi:hypothetical protein
LVYTGLGIFIEYISYKRSKIFNFQRFFNNYMFGLFLYSVFVLIWL